MRAAAGLGKLKGPSCFTRPNKSGVTPCGDTGCSAGTELEATTGRKSGPADGGELSGISLKGHRLLQPACSRVFCLSGVSHADLRPGSKLGVTFPAG